MNIASVIRNSGSCLGAAPQTERPPANRGWYRKPLPRTIGNAGQTLFENQLIGGSFMLADFAGVPMGVTGGVKELVAEALKLGRRIWPFLQAGSHAHHHRRRFRSRHGRNSRLSPPHAGVAPRVLTSITIDDRRGATGRLEGKVRDVEQVLGKPLSRV